MAAPSRNIRPMQKFGGKSKRPMPETFEVDLSNLKALPEGEMHDLDVNADAWGRPAPPPKGVYQFKIFCPVNRSVSGRYRVEKVEGTQYYLANLECRVVNSKGKQYDNAVMFDGNISTLVPRGRDISTMAALMHKCKQTIPAKATDKQILLQFIKWVKTEPVGYADTDWQGYSKAEERVTHHSMTSFPQGDDGTYEHTVELASGEEIVATGRIKRWLTFEEAKELQKQYREAAAALKVQPIREVEEEAAEEEEESAETDEEMMEEEAEEETESEEETEEEESLGDEDEEEEEEEEEPVVVTKPAAKTVKAAVVATKKTVKK